MMLHKEKNLKNKFHISQYSFVKKIAATKLRDFQSFPAKILKTPTLNINNS